jgi:hypothetical protein
MASYDVKVRRSYTERDCPPCPTTCKCGSCSKSKDSEFTTCDAVTTAGALGAAAAGFALGGPVGAIIGFIAGAGIGTGICDEMKKK